MVVGVRAAETVVKRLFFLVAVWLLATPAGAQNVTSANAVGLRIGQTPVPAIVTAAAPERWFFVHTRFGRSYCAELSRVGDDETGTGLPAHGAVGRITVYRDDATSVYAQGSGSTSTAPGGQQEPYAADLGRACFVQTAGDQTNFLRVTNESLPASGHFLLRVVETTLFCNWFYGAGDYRAFLVAQNTTKQPVVGAIEAFTTAIGPTAPLAVAAQAVALVDVPAALGASSGSVRIAHSGAPDAINASVITMSPATGISWESACSPRQPW